MSAGSRHGRDFVLDRESTGFGRQPESAGKAAALLSDEEGQPKSMVPCVTMVAQFGAELGFAWFAFVRHNPIVALRSDGLQAVIAPCMKLGVVWSC